MDNQDRCVCCGEPIPEGRQVCPACEYRAEIIKKEKVKRKVEDAVMIAFLAGCAALCLWALCVATRAMTPTRIPKPAAKMQQEEPLPPVEQVQEPEPLTEEQIVGIEEAAAVYECGEGVLDSRMMVMSPAEINPSEVIAVPTLGWCASEEELELAARIVWLEARGESATCQRCVAEVIFNRLRSGIWGTSLCEVIYAVDQNGYAEFTTACHAWDAETELDQKTLEMVKNVFYNGCRIPKRIMYFHAGRYHSWFGAVDEFYIDNTYFSSSAWAAE